MAKEGGKTQRIEPVRTVVAHVVVTCKHSFARPTTHATRLAPPSRKLNRPCVMAPYGLITQCLPGGRHPCLPLGGLSALAGLSRFPYGAPSPPNTCGESPRTRARIGAIIGAPNTLGEGSLGRARQVDAPRHLRLAASPETRSAHLYGAHDQNGLVQQIRLSCGPGHLLAPHCEKKARLRWSFSISDMVLLICHTAHGLESAATDRCCKQGSAHEKHQETSSETRDRGIRQKRAGSPYALSAAVRCSPALRSPRVRTRGPAGN